MAPDQLIPADAGRLDLWHVPLRETVASGALPACDALLSPEERRRTTQFRFREERDRYRATRASVRLILSRYVERQPAHWQFGAGPLGKPTVADEGARAMPFDFSVSHTDETIVVAVGWGRRVGVDVESTGNAGDDGVASDCLTVHELHAYGSLRDDARRRRFVELWTLKESHLKARGVGLSLSMQDLSFDVSADEVGFRCGGAHERDATRWNFWQLALSSHEVVSVCTEGTAYRDAMVRTLVPLRSERPARFVTLRRSPGLTFQHPCDGGASP